MVRMFTNGTGDQGSISSKVLPKTQKWYSLPLCLTLSSIRYGSRVREIPEKECCPPPPLIVVAIEKGAFRSSRTTIDQLMYIFILLLVQREKKVNILEWIGPWRDLFFSFFILLLHVFLAFYCYRHGAFNDVQWCHFLFILWRPLWWVAVLRVLLKKRCQYTKMTATHYFK